jgi:penicillin-binding protein 1A
MTRNKRISLAIFSVLLILVVVPSVYLALLYRQVTAEAASLIQKGAIRRIIASESPVYYDDNLTPIGVFFEEIHRTYLPYEKIPKHFVKALIAAEDTRFFAHDGLDFRAIIRAFVANIRAGKVVQGGSTLTQQTAKNIFRRQKRSYQAKIKELMQAFLLERQYRKEEILEMYANQFFVTGFGKGLSVAAQYFFDKEAEELDLVEAAFIAGSVKGPNRYNPFIKKTEAEKTEAGRLAKQRKDYVLQNMFKLHFITRDQLQTAIGMDVPFREGKITYELNVVLDYVREQLEGDFFQRILRDQGVANIATSGIRIYTSVNQEIQGAALNALRRHLASLNVQLSGYDPKRSGPPADVKKPASDLPFFARITHVDPTRENAYLVVAWEQGGGVIDYEGLEEMGDAWLKWKEGSWATFDSKQVSSFLRVFEVGDVVAVRSRPDPSDEGRTVLCLTAFPELDGAVVVLKKGMIKAMVGGFYDRYFNRAADAKRQLGSIFKPIVYAAALQLKWNLLDTLMNVQDVYRFENTEYVPRPDHTPESEKVSLVWAGAKSENLATVWLLYHLTDYLNTAEFRSVAELLDFTQRKDEAYTDYRKRVRDHYGVVVDKGALLEAAFEHAKRDVESDAIFAGGEEALTALDRLHFTQEMRRGSSERAGFPEPWLWHFRRLRELDQEMRKALETIAGSMEGRWKAGTPSSTSALERSLVGFYRTSSESADGKILYTKAPERVQDTMLIPVTTAWLHERPQGISPRNVWIDGLVPSAIVGLLQDQLKKNYREFLAQRRYDFDVLSSVRDFRVLVNLAYVVHLSKQMGIRTPLDPVLSFPLGPNAISILEASLVYETFMTGKAYPVSGDNALDMAPVITRIEDREGEILWEYEPTPREILSKRAAALVTEILGKVVDQGTGRRAKGAVRLVLDAGGEPLALPIPSFGKTGTANRFTNSSFVGFIPGTDKKNAMLDLQEGYVIAVYVGFDDNRPMKGEHVVIYGASGALPVWIDTANAVAASKEFRGALQPADFAFADLKVSSLAEGLQNVHVSPLDGLPESLSVTTDLATLSVLTELEWTGRALVLGRTFEPLMKGAPR